jgi:hypothetical protein
MIYQHPLAYLLGLEGIALLRAWAGDFDKAFVDRRLAEIRRLLARAATWPSPVHTTKSSSAAPSPTRWAPTTNPD